MQAMAILTFYHFNLTGEAVLANVFQNGSNSTREATPPEEPESEHRPVVVERTQLVSLTHTWPTTCACGTLVSAPRKPAEQVHLLHATTVRARKGEIAAGGGDGSSRRRVSASAS
jgi:hypothetical protein